MFSDNQVDEEFDNLSEEDLFDMGQYNLDKENLL